MPYSNKKSKSMGLSLLLSTILCILIVIVLLCLEAFVLSFFKNPLPLVKPVTTILGVIVFFVCGIVSDKFTSLGALGALLTCSVLSLIKIGVCLFAGGETTTFVSCLIITLIQIGAGVFSGFLSARHRNEKKKAKQHVKRRTKR